MAGSMDRCCCGCSAAYAYQFTRVVNLTYSTQFISGAPPRRRGENYWERISQRIQRALVFSVRVVSR